MDPFNLDVEALSQETFDLLNDQQTFNFIKEEPEHTEPANIRWPDSEGIIYWIVEQENTFLLNGFSVDNLQKTGSLLIDGQDDILPKEKEQSFLDANKIYFLETGSNSLSEMVSDQMFNRRFPYKESQIFNIGDPGIDWWLRDNGSSLEVFFNSQRAGDRDNLVCLGPIGDPNIAAHRFNSSLDLINNILGANYLTSKEKSIIINNSSQSFMSELFINGKFDLELIDFGVSTKSKTLFYYLQELALSRKLWMDISKILHAD